MAAEHHVFRLQIAMDDPTRVRIPHRLTDLHERLEQLALELETVSRLAGPATMKLGDRVAQVLPSQKAHRVERLIVFLAPGQLVHRNDVGMFELAGDLRFLEEPAPRFRIGDGRGLDFLECDIAIEIGVVGDPDLAQTPFGMQPREGVTQRVALSGRGHERFHEDVAPGRRRAHGSTGEPAGS